MRCHFTRRCDGRDPGPGLDEGQYVADSSDARATDAPAGVATPVFHLYAGPLSRNVFSDDRYSSLANVITYPMAPDWLARLLLAIFDLFKGLTSSAGLAVLMMTLTVRGGLMPLLNAPGLAKELLE